MNTITGATRVKFQRWGDISIIFIPASFACLFNMDHVKLSRKSNYLIILQGTLGDRKVVSCGQGMAKRIYCGTEVSTGVIPEWVFSGNPLPLKRYKNGFAIPIPPDGRCIV
jgi:hypothetical protein